MASSFFSYAQRLPNTVPKPSNASLLCSSIPSRVCSGDDVEAMIDDSIYPCRVIDIRFDYSPARLLVKIWLPESKIPSDVDPLEPLNPSTDGRVIGMRGVMHSNWLRWIYAEAVIDFAFIFHCDTLTTGMFSNVYGMKNSYYCRHEIFSANIQSHLVRIYEKDSHSSFSHLISSSFPESSHHRIFQFLSEMRRNVDKVLWTERKFMNANGIGRSLPIFISKECWDYFCARLCKDSSYAGYSFVPKQGRRTIKNYFHDLSSQAISFHCNIFYIEAWKKEHFSCLRGMFGTGWGYGVRRPKVTKSSGLANLSVYEKINVLDFLSEDQDEGNIESNEDAPEMENKVIFTFNTLTSQVSIRYYYRFVRVSSDRGRYLLREINHVFANEEEGEIIMTQSTFMYEGNLFQTLPHISGQPTITCVDLFGNGAERTFQVHEVRALINMHNSSDINGVDNDL